MVLWLDEKHIALFVEPDFVWVVKLGLQSWPAIACVTFFARPGDSGDYAGAVNSSDDVIHQLAEVKRAVRPSRDAEWIIEQRFCGLSAVARVTSLSRACESFDLRFLWRRASR
jgi:hypothetical protein